MSDKHTLNLDYQVRQARLLKKTLAERNQWRGQVAALTAQRDRLADALRALVDAIDGVQDWNGTHVGDARTAALAELEEP